MKITIKSPQTQRDATDPTPVVPPDASFFADLRTLDRAALRELGLRPWNDPNDVDDDEHALDVARFGEGGELWLFPGEWYAQIPEGFEVVDVFGERELFRKGVSDDDVRLGCLPFGIIVGGAT